jgi:23S rRNA pseudouridine1911/1915/1917 synthase
MSMENQEMQSYRVDADDVGLRLDRFCTAKCESLSRNRIQALNRDGGITVDGRVRPDSYALREGEHVEIRVLVGGQAGPGEFEKPAGQDIPLSVAHEDDEIVLLNKPAGLVVHPAHGNWDNTLVNALIGRGTPLAAVGGAHRPGIVHRLDKDTSGLIVVAKTDAAYAELADQIKRKEIRKEYHGIVVGNLAKRRMTVDAPIGRHPIKRQKMAVTPSAGKEALTELFVVDSYNHFDYIRIATYTGRTHQIRVHLSHLACPLLGDAVYGGRRRRWEKSSSRAKITIEKLMKIMSRHALHASMLSFVHPVTGRRMTFRAALPADMQLALETLHNEDRIKEV